MSGPGAPKPSSLRALVVGRYPLVLAAFAQLLSDPPLNAAVELATRSDEAIDSVVHDGFQLVFCDLRAEPLPGPEVAGKLTELGVLARVILVADLEDAASLVMALQCGAAGFFTKDASPQEFLEGVCFVAAGHYAIGRSVAQPALGRLAGHEQTVGPLSRLSPTEQSIFSMVGEAHSTRGIAAARGISQKTVRNHLANIYRKLELNNRSEAILWSARMRRSQEGSDSRSEPDDQP
jgi:DNA-binding NarL/FixJ family response regulator